MHLSSLETDMYYNTKIKFHKLRQSIDLKVFSSLVLIIKIITDLNLIVFLREK